MHNPMASWHHDIFFMAYLKRCSTWINHLHFMGCLTHLSFNFSRHGFCTFCFRWKRRGFFKLFCKSFTILLLKFFIQVLNNTIGFILQRTTYYQPKFLCLFDVNNIFLWNNWEGVLKIFMMSNHDNQARYAFFFVLLNCLMMQYRM